MVPGGIVNSALEETGTLDVFPDGFLSEWHNIAGLLESMRAATERGSMGLSLGVLRVESVFDERYMCLGGDASKSTNGLVRGCLSL